ncbi:MAG: hypothetical protein LBU34_04765 [Planctomycetaceae bacterium]|jgi:hypothetical protein|nr:hypothetical protein [Planctomycetaceae bacterium]
MKTTTVTTSVFDIDNIELFRKFSRNLEEDFPFIRVSKIEVREETVLESNFGGMRIFCLYRGNGEVFLPKGYRTQEGDGDSLPVDLYQPDPIDPNFASLLQSIQEKRSNISAKADVPINAIMERWNTAKEFFCGDITGELWRLLEQAPRPWSSDSELERIIESLFLKYRNIGFSTKSVDSWEKIMTGDQLIVTQTKPLRVRGHFSCFSIENVNRKTSHVSEVRRLRFLLDTAGGCSPGFDPFRRLPITWFPNYPDETGDGLNFFNNHVVNIPAENSPTHFHPKIPIGGGLPQTEFYLVLDPNEYQLSTAGLETSITLYPDLRNLEYFETHHLQPGMIVYMPPGTGHRGQNVFALIMTIPGFKPGNELYLDKDIFEQTNGHSPYNENHLQSKNYERLEDYI